MWKCEIRILRDWLVLLSAKVDFCGQVGLSTNLEKEEDAGQTQDSSKTRQCALVLPRSLCLLVASCYRIHRVIVIVLMLTLSCYRVTVYIVYYPEIILSASPRLSPQSGACPLASEYLAVLLPNKVAQLGGSMDDK